MKVWVVEDTYQYDGGSIILGVYTYPNDALILQQKYQNEIRSKSHSNIDTMCKAIKIREIQLNQEIIE